jgi:hypothetical protein
MCPTDPTLDPARISYRRVLDIVEDAIPVQDLDLRLKSLLGIAGCRNLSMGG